MALSNTATPKYYGMFRDAVLRGDIPVCEEISMEMNRIDALIANPGVWYDDQAIQGFINFCERELTLTNGLNRFLGGITSLSEVSMSRLMTDMAVLTLQRQLKNV